MELNIKFDEKLMVETANRVLDEYEYNGKTIREWADLIANPKTNADRIRAMTDEELAYELAVSGCPKIYFSKDKGRVECRAESELTEDDCVKCWLGWLKQEVSE